MIFSVGDITIDVDGEVESVVVDGKFVKIKVKEKIVIVPAINTPLIPLPGTAPVPYWLGQAPPFVIPNNFPPFVTCGGPNTSNTNNLPHILAIN